MTRALALGGTCSGEHGIGLHKMDFLVSEAGDGAVEIMRTIKRALDPLSPAEEKRSDTQILRLGLAGSPLAKGDVRFTQDDSFGIFTAWIYLTHD